MANPQPAIFDPDNPLEPVTYETRRANNALHDYAYMGDNRSLRNLLERYKEAASQTDSTRSVPTTSWTTLSLWSIKFSWQQRVRAFDTVLRKEDEAEFSAQQRTWRKQRRDVLRVMYNKVIRVVANLDIDDVRFSDAVRALTVVHEEIRKEFGDDEPESGPEVKVTIYLPDNQRGGERYDDD